MAKMISELETLARRVKYGDAGAQTELRESLQSAMVHIVRSTLQSGSCFHGLGRHILAEARCLAPDADPTEAWERLYRPVARRLCERILARVSPAAMEPLRDTIRN
jgi:hypothetical protein